MREKAEQAVPLGYGRGDFVGRNGRTPRRTDSWRAFREIEDSGRAKVIEEAIAAIAFEHARGHRFFDGVRFVDSSLLETVRRMTAGLEVRVRTARDWELAILRSFEVWREMRVHEGGKLLLDLENRRVTFAPLA